MNTDSSQIDIRSELIAIRSQLFALLIALIVVSGTLTVYLYRQASMARKDIDAIKPQADQVVKVLSENQTAVVTFVNDIVAYGQSHPDFKPVLAKYGIAPVPGHPAVAEPMAPVTPAVPKK
jgi:hypothetical protein